MRSERFGKNRPRLLLAPNPDEIALYAGSLQDVSHPKLFIQVGETGGRTAPWQTGHAMVPKAET
jgi:hypothetical protein